MAPRTLDEFRRAVAAELERTQRGFKTPEDDWPNMALWVQSPRGIDYANIGQLALRAHGLRMTHGSEKAAAVKVVKDAIALWRAYRYAFVMNAHMLDQQAEDDEDLQARAAAIDERVNAGERLEYMEGSFEVLTMTVGDADEEQVWFARIERDGRGIRTLAEWERVDRHYDTISGRMVGFNEALRRRPA